MAKHIVSFIGLTFTEKLMLFEALFFQYIIRLLMFILPSRRVLKLFQYPVKPVKHAEEVVLERVKAANAQANLLALWKNRCLVQSLSARAMLACRGIASHLHFGLAAGPGGNAQAHAWLTAGTFEVVNRGQAEVEFIKGRNKTIS